ncbi:3-keto-5-aminohexanoate cleavage protein [Bradyrhizobium nitroreducens]|uniref:3-keto-5-aminohexanoate cleavage protein n=1 Tax=Bradyrhizobium nitroreducens TaxID=709803 RepID=A0A2M6U700_9BRAD|nr:3-keto-5-aminohexanoate cleavage protein [Bradyrhizobium nitroreducens]PIT00364.1 3-keto-5-aminohexanoate cleavage protein [Bradyrhizobium nitroreducens]
MSSNKIIVTIAPTGGMAKKSQNPNLPTQPDEIAESVYRCFNAGASVAALHVRRPDDEATCNAEIYRRVNALVKAKCNIVINNSTGGGVDGDMLIERPDGLYDVNFEERLKGLDAGAEMATFDCFTVAAIHGRREMLVSTTPSQCDRLAERFKQRGIKPEWEVFNPAHILQDVTRLIAAGYDKPPYFINIVLNADRGFQGAMPYTPEILQMMVRLIPKGAIFNVSAIGTAQVPATTHAILLGGHVRVGLEDNLYYAKGVHATNEMLVERQVRIIRELGFEPATPEEARQMMGLS